MRVISFNFVLSDKFHEYNFYQCPKTKFKYLKTTILKKKWKGGLFYAYIINSYILFMFYKLICKIYPCINLSCYKDECNFENARWSQHTCIFARCQLFTSWWKFMLYSTMYQHLITGCKFNKISLHLMGLWHHIITVWKKRKNVYTPHNGILNIIK